MVEDYPKHTYCMEKEGLHKVCKYSDPETWGEDGVLPSQNSWKGADKGLLRGESRTLGPWINQGIDRRKKGPYGAGHGHHLHSGERHAGD